MTTKIFIMAQGKGSRWMKDIRNPDWEPPADFKQLIMIGDEPIITRTVRILNEDHKHFDLRIVCPGYFLRFLPEGTPIRSFREPVGSLINGLAQTSDEWEGYHRIIFLLGDVVYSRRLLDDIVQVRMGNHFFFLRLSRNIFTGKESPEIFAYVFQEVDQEGHAQLLRSMGDNDFEKLWDIYVYLSQNNDFYADDYTDDIDSPQEYEQFHSELERWALMD